MTTVVQGAPVSEIGTENKSRRAGRRAATLLVMSMLGAGLGVAALPPANAATWLGGVHFTAHPHTAEAAWQLFNNGPTQNQYNRMLKDCRAMGGNSITKAGTGTITVNYFTHVYSVTWDYSCWTDTADQ